MLCPTCSADCRPNQKFCGECGTSLPHLPTASTSAPAFAPPTEAAPIQDFVFEPVTTMMDLVTAELGTPTEAIAIVEQTTAPIHVGEHWDTGSPTEEHAPWPVDDPTPTGMLIPPRWVPSLALSIVAGVAGAATIVGAFLPQLNAKSDAPIAKVLGDYMLNDLATAAPVGGLFTGTNLQVGIIVAGALMCLGAIAAAFGRRLGAGLAGGAAISLLPFVVLIWDNISKITDAVAQQAQLSKQQNGLGSFVNTAPAAGFYVLVGAAAIGAVALVLSAIHARDDGHPPLNSALAWLGAFASLGAAAGQLIAQHSASFSDNFSTTNVGTAAVVSRLEIIVLVVGCGVIGFARRNRWGLGFAVGAAGVYAWQWLSSLTELGDYPAPPAFGNPGNAELKPHIVTTVGLAAMLAFATVSMIIASLRDRNAS